MTHAAPRVLFLGTTYAGWKTRQQNLEAHTRNDTRIRAEYRHITGWNRDGLIERLPLPCGVRGRLRATIEAAPFARMPRPDVIWTSCAELLSPWAWAQLGPLRRPLVVETDWSLAQQEAMARWYFGREPRTGLSLWMAKKREQGLIAGTSLFTPISNWAADGLRQVGVPDSRIRVLHPGVDLGMWRVPERRLHERKLRLLFVGGDFARKGGDMLLDVMRGPLAQQFELDIVTRDEVPPQDGVRVHRCEPNSPELLRRYAEADLFVLPTRAECFGHATVEAMASGLPVIAGDVGGVRDIVQDGETGWLIAPEPAALVAALEDAAAKRWCLPEMGARGRRVAEQKFDGARNDDLLVELLVDQAKRWTSRSRERADVLAGCL